MAGRTAIGLDIGTSGVRAAELSFGKNGITLEKFGQVALPEGAVRDGEVHDAEAVATALKQLWAHTKFSSRDVVVGVANQKVIVRQVDLPWAPLDELKETLGYQVQETIPMPVEQALLDFYPLEELTGEGGSRLLRGLLVAAARDMVSAQLAAVQAAGLKPVMVDLTAFAVLRSLADVDDLGMGGSRLEALVDVGARVTNIIVHESGVPRFVRILLMGGQDVTDAVIERIGVSGVQAEAIKHEQGMQIAGDDADDQAAGRVMDAAGQQFVDQVRGSLDYYSASSGSQPIERILLTGGGSRLSGLVERLQSATRIEVVRGNPFAELVVGKTGLSPEQMQFVEPLATVPVGLALGGAA
ncbi:MAG: type IV pilus assembly protein PilM [Actinomycetes bacterium]